MVCQDLLRTDPEKAEQALRASMLSHFGKVVAVRLIDLLRIL